MAGVVGRTSPKHHPCHPCLRWLGLPGLRRGRGESAGVFETRVVRLTLRGSFAFVFQGEGCSSAGCLSASANRSACSSLESRGRGSRACSALWLAFGRRVRFSICRLNRRGCSMFEPNQQDRLYVDKSGSVIDSSRCAHSNPPSETTEPRRIAVSSVVWF